jgi:drug/metabolite transporter (DMT)-like permease
VDGTGQAARPSLLIGILCGTAAALGWAAGFVAAKHGITVGFSPADLAFHRFFWSGLLLLPLALRGGLADLGGIGWGRGLVMTVLAGPPQAAIAYTGFILVPLGHGTTIQPACAALFGLILASLMLHERATA